MALLHEDIGWNNNKIKCRNKCYSTYHFVLHLYLKINKSLLLLRNKSYYNVDIWQYSTVDMFYFSYL
ncbi:hypothetical protein B296_00056636 [Ensete ventricosum]|uniref:Uncharacterized protein n=1 Tax=Ensete ventricosum TaxID=4639 RepID=A0A426XDF6_ENSVE|nr:hypothetical protein B296_00056636 [Ensete ventricosum]